MNIGSVRLLLHDVTSCVLWVCVCQLEDSGDLDRVLLYCQATAGRLMMELRMVTNDDLYIKTSGFCKPQPSSFVDFPAQRALVVRPRVNKMACLFVIFIMIIFIPLCMRLCRSHRREQTGLWSTQPPAFCAGLLSGGDPVPGAAKELPCISVHERSKLLLDHFSHPCGGTVSPLATCTNYCCDVTCEHL